MLSLDENAEFLSDFGLTRNQAKVYLTIAKLGIASVSQVSKVSKVRREDVYRILPKLEKMGLAEKILGKPARIRATPVEEGLSLLIKRQQDTAKKKISALAARKDKILKHFKAYRVKLISEEAHFSLISHRDGIINKKLVMIKKAKTEIDIITSRDEFIRIFTIYAEPLKKAIKKGVKVRAILDAHEHEDPILIIVKEYKSSGASFDIRYKDQPSGHYIIVDYNQTLVATTTEAPMPRSPCLWTDDNNLVGLMQKNFEAIWHTSVNMETIETDAVADKVTRLLMNLKPTDHVIFLYQSLEAKYNVLFNYVKVGLENGEAVAYIATEENPSEIKDAMERFGIDVGKNEKAGALQILGHNDFYIIGGKFNPLTTKGLIKKMYSEAMKKGFNGFRVTGEMQCFFEHNLIPELVEYERSLHRVFDIPVIGLCAYNANTVIEASNPMDLYNELLKAHGTVLFAGIDNKLGKIEIRKV